jgi:hypothetical protein
MVAELKSSGITGKEGKTLERLFMKKDEAVVKAFEQYVGEHMCMYVCMCVYIDERLFMQEG